MAQQGSVGENTWRYIALVFGGLCVLASAAAEILVFRKTIAGIAHPDSMKDFLTAVAGLSGVTAGFVITAKSVLLTLPNSPVIQNVLSEGAYPGIVRLMSASAAWSVAVGVLSCVLILIPKSTFPAVYAGVLSVWIGSVAVVAVSFGRFLWVFLSMSHRVAQDRTNEAMKLASKPVEQRVAFYENEASKAEGNAKGREAALPDAEHEKPRSSHEGGA